MPAHQQSKDLIASHLQSAVRALHRDMERVDLWASALIGFSQQVPDYEATGEKLNRYLLPSVQREPAGRSSFEAAGRRSQGGRDRYRGGSETP